MASSPTPRARLPLEVLLAYGVGEISVTISMTLFGLFILFFYTSVMHLPATLTGIGASAGLLWDALIDPYIGYRSDNHRGRLGRRHGFMLGGALLTGVTFWLLLSPPPGLGTAALFAWLLGTTLLFRFAAALFRIPYLGLGAEMSQDYHQRTSIVGVRSLFGLAGTLAAATLSFVFFFPNRIPGVDPKLDYDGYPPMGFAFGLAMTVAGVIATVGTLGHRHGAPRAAAGAGDFRRGFLSAWQNRGFRRVWLAFTLFAFGVVVNAAVAIHYFTWYVRITDSHLISRLQLSLYAGALLGVVPWVRIARRLEKRSLCLVAVVALAVLMSLASVLFGEGHFLGTGNARVLSMGSLLAGFFAAALWVLPPSMLADVTDEDELRTGQRREGLFFGLLNLGEKIAAGAALLCAGVLLDVFVGLVPGATPPAGAVSRIGVLYGILPAVILVGSALAVAGYRLDRRAVLEIQGHLRRRETPEPVPAREERPAAVVGEPVTG
jgi:GPH family glycoside/pentoside/hexuronide:cation symporter